jgi:geranylgeranyl diphosphate synthase, type I
MDFAEQLGAYKKAIDSDIATYSEHVRKVTAKQYGEHPMAVTNAYLAMLESGGKRIRGALAIVGYKMCGGTDMQMITRAASALEMIHAYILVIDDIQDRSKRRRGQPTVHESLTTYARSQKLSGDVAHTGVALALNAALLGAHAAQVLLAGLSVDPELRLKAIGIINNTMITTAHGQTADIMNELLPQTDLQDVEHALEWKTAHYTMLNPLCVGMVLAGAGCEDTDAIRDYALNTGKTFQITDDIIGIFGTDEQTGKSAMDDIREGKRTILTSYALEHAAPADREFLRRCLGDANLTKSAFERCRHILRDSGALGHAERLAKDHVQIALSSLDEHHSRWNRDGVLFLEGLVQSLLYRTT